MPARIPADFTGTITWLGRVADRRAALVVDMENRLCTLPAKPIEGRHPGLGRAFRRAAKGRRGVTAWMEREGTFRVGEQVRLFVPDQPVWAHLDAARIAAAKA